MIIEVGSGGWPASAMALGLGIWFFFGWCWFSAERNQRLVMTGLFGLVTAAALFGGVTASWIVGERGLSSIGAFAGGSVILMVATLVWRQEGPGLLDHLVPGAIAGLSISRLGCLFEGCDFGRSVDSGIAVVHQAGSRAWEIHVAQYGLSSASRQSLAVVPFAAYLALWGIISAGLGEWQRRRGQTAGRSATASAAVFLTGAGFIEWLRDPITVPQIADGISAYPLIYWIGAVMTAILWWRLGAIADLAKIWSKA